MGLPLESTHCSHRARPRRRPRSGGPRRPRRSRSCVRTPLSTVPAERVAQHLEGVSRPPHRRPRLRRRRDGPVHQGVVLRHPPHSPHPAWLPRFEDLRRALCRWRRRGGRGLEGGVSDGAVVAGGSAAVSGSSSSPPRTTTSATTSATAAATPIAARSQNRPLSARPTPPVEVTESAGCTGAGAWCCGADVQESGSRQASGDFSRTAIVRSTAARSATRSRRIARRFLGSASTPSPYRETTTLTSRSTARTAVSPCPRAALQSSSCACETPHLARGCPSLATSRPRTLR